MMVPLASERMVPVLGRQWFFSLKMINDGFEFVDILGACPILTFLLRRRMHQHLLRSRPRKILNVFQRIRLRFFVACGLASTSAYFASSRTAMSDRLLTALFGKLEVFEKTAGGFDKKQDLGARTASECAKVLE
ncbi:MAG: hypothetical protein P0120_09100 [Nitrospira sp.]|nr:hypothetical protein [Nitrospira sp.]